MSIDGFYTLLEGEFVRIFEQVSFSDFWVDICHGGGFVIDERYYFPDLTSALDFYTNGWKDRQFVDKKGKKMGLDHKGLYSQGRLIHGLSIHGDVPGHDGENLRKAVGALAEHLRTAARRKAFKVVRKKTTKRRRKA